MGAHDPSMSQADLRRFMAQLGAVGVRYEDLATDLEIDGLPRPTEGSALYRRLIVSIAHALGRCEAWEVAERVRRMYDPALHLPAPLPVDPPEYVAALTTEQNPATIPGAQIRWLKRLGAAPADAAAATVARMTSAQRAAAAAIAARLTAIPECRIAAARLA